MCYRGSGARRGEGTGQRGQQEAAAVHAGTIGGSIVERKHVALVRPPRDLRPAVARHPDDRPIDAGVQVAAVVVVGEEGVHSVSGTPLGSAYRRTLLALR
jgi:hypothetical protein